METKIADKLLLTGDLCISAMAVGLFWSASSGNFREKLWEHGGIKGWNSNPNLRIYFYANYEEPPEIPLIWSQSLTDAMLAVALLSLVLLAARVTLAYFGHMSRTVSLIYDALLVFFWLHSIESQASGDFSDPEHPSPRPWYLTHHCRGQVVTACRVAQANFAISILAALFYGVRLLATAAGAVEAYREYRKGGYRLDPVDLDLTNGEDWASQGACSEREGKRQMYRDYLSPVLAFFPEDHR
ncbi:hypothetical protein CGRA01v4_05999 [Colletotrichum graminicola]|uniref:Uncharacterized protein n=1 Tax=Colletotrichum graminicola (strain M1.001 / M2 / FGSC 10212) TaxID=645133 RepID=E3QYU2_COLGM|nr:uncharacterized protein GLRG_11174 [Colletotrichum graminicola M1.001]EFQ36030.1 hypothetical protein GLRG_11174 [Colletotrichum graminicola M1.001]WDK14718.1 hypothetical protein CGRA01v4_05999 [Colletotrichum graminicola]